MNQRILHVSGASYRRAPRVHRVIRHSSFVIARRALTLVEMLISMAITLLMMAAIVNLFANIGSGVKIRQAAMEMSGQLRMARATLFNDLAGATCRALPWQRPDEDPGYLEIVEGGRSDKNPSALVSEPNIETVNGLNSRTSLVPRDNSGRLVQFTDSNNNGIYDSGTDAFLGNASALGDYDDILALTVRSEIAPFRGRSFDTTANQVVTIESNVAEVIWFAVENPADPNSKLGEPGMRTIYRRVMLVAPWVDPIDLTAYPTPTSGASLAANDANAFYQRYDISARFDTSTSRWIPNTLGDLTKRENRFAHEAGTFPHVILQTQIRNTPPGLNGPLHPYGEPWVTLNTARGDPDRQGEDVMLTDVLAFDLLVFDPGAPLFDYQGTVVEPSPDNVFGLAVQAALAGPPAGALSGFGAYVDLGWDNGSSAGPSIPDYDPNAFPGAPNTLFQQERRVRWHPNSPNANRGTPSVYDTWSFHYEHDGINQDGDGLTDEGTNGLDDDGLNGVDDIRERETSPPYPVPLRGMQVKIRVYDPDTRQIREASVTRNFVPQ